MDTGPQGTYRVAGDLFSCDAWGWDNRQSTLNGERLVVIAGSRYEDEDGDASTREYVVDFRFPNGWIVELALDGLQSDHGDVGLYQTVSATIGEHGRVVWWKLVRRDGMRDVPPAALLALLGAVARRDDTPTSGWADASVSVSKYPAPPWFAQGFGYEVLDEEHREALRAAADILIDQCFDDAVTTRDEGWTARDLWLADYLPPAYLPRLTGLQVRQFAVALTTVVWKLAQPDWVPLACLAEELALHTLIEQATVLLDLDGKEAHFADFEDAAYQDMDFLHLFSPNEDGFEDSLAGKYLRMGSLALADWHATFSGAGGVPVHPYVEGDDYRPYRGAAM